MSIRRTMVRCTVCGEASALILTGDGNDRTYNMEFYTARGWSFTKYKTMCPKCREAERERWEQIGRRCQDEVPEVRSGPAADRRQPAHS